MVRSGSIAGGASRGNLRRIHLAATSLILFVAAGWVSTLAAHLAIGLEALWLANAVLLGILITQARDTWDQVAVITAGLAGGLFLHVARADPSAITLLFSVANIVEAAAALLFLRLMGASRLRFDRVSDVIAFIVACAAAPLGSATLGATGLTLAGGSFAQAWGSWYFSSVLSLLVFTSMIIVGAQLRERRHLRAIAARAIAEVIIVLGLVAIVAGLVFFVGSLPLLFLVAPTMLIATFRLRVPGAVAAVGIVALIAAYATASGQGPIGNADGTPAEHLLLLQTFIATTFLSALPVAAMLAERDARAEDARGLADRFRTVVENIGEVIFRTDAEGRWIYLNPAWEQLSGYSIIDSLGQSWLEHADDADLVEARNRTAPVFANIARAARCTLRFHTAAGVRWVELYVRGVRDSDGKFSGTAGTLRDIDDRKRLEEHVLTARARAEQRAREATLLASTDELTGIANRRAFLRHLDREIEGSTEFGWPLAVAMFDVDHFKAVNDGYGHAVGDRVLRLIAERASAVVRSGDLVGRLGGEEFGILMPGATAEDAAIVAERLRQAMETPRAGEEAGLPTVTVSVGIAAREDQTDAGALLAVADAALYAAKDAGRNRVKIAA